MNRVIVSTAFSKESDARLVIKAGQILAGMTGNTHYPNPSPALPAVQTAADAFQAALEAAADGGKVKTAEKNQAREFLLGLLRALALYVQQNCRDNLAILLSSGFEARKTPQPSGILPAPEGVTLTAGTLSGQLNLRGRPVTNAASYEAQSSMDVTKEEDWNDVGTFSSTRITLEELTPGTLYWARFRAIGSSGPGGWSEAVSAYAV